MRRAVKLGTMIVIECISFILDMTIIVLAGAVIGFGGLLYILSAHAK